jgi:hypothetical protein
MRSFFFGFAQGGKVAGTADPRAFLDFRNRFNPSICNNACLISAKLPLSAQRLPV